MAYLWYEHHAAGIQDALPHFSPPAPPAANDPDFNDPGCPPDCRQWRESLNRMYQALTRSEEAGLAGQLDVQWRLFRQSVKDYEKQCGKYEPPPSLHEIYTR